MGTSGQFKPGDTVVHPRRPEWGDGVVHQAQSIVHEGIAAQRLVVTFANHGRVTINTAVAPLIAKESISSMAPTTSPSSTASIPSGRNGKGWLDMLGQPQSADHELWRLPESMTDPFISIAKRLAATLDSFRFGNDPHHARNLLDWAVAQTALNDPLSKYTRHEMEQAFRRFLRDRDNHLFELVRTIKRQGRPDLLEEARRSANNALAKNTLERAIRI